MKRIGGNCRDVARAALTAAYPHLLSAGTVLDYLTQVKNENACLRARLEAVVDASTWSEAVQSARAALSDEGGDDG
jgi:hypothetical protein